MGTTGSSDDIIVYFFIMRVSPLTQESLAACTTQPHGRARATTGAYNGPLATAYRQTNPLPLTRYGRYTLFDKGTVLVKCFI